MTYPKLSFTGTSFSSNHESTINSKPAPIAKQDLKKAKLIQVPMIYIDAFENIKNEGYTSLSFSSYLIEALKEKIICDVSRLDS
ncbi:MULTISPECIES: hypothetical protein [Providencia]|uniref:Uncharacterized protein n=1 Tax=Providencia huashanensis TaxID=3037798 RepID=A0AA42FI08_9GAMM|nr:MULTISPECIES: hypothetical protein [Providencia]APC11916.1 hypothetical protein RB151_022440 [Providencia rettgeri]AVL75234.1 hypothetical protein CEQ08_16605 [Providencia rettgeri]EIL1984247.1 hypothetical protein [Providencia rettgeri]EIU7555011.1 hypothetical protein [Providencia rettgeri]EJD6041365.1 hypothetical protein [Providencia rettgeri]